MISEKLEKAFNDQINKELYSEYLYLSMQAYFERLNLKGFVNWMTVQVQEEHAHAMGMFNYVHERGGKVELEAIAIAETEQADGDIAVASVAATARSSCCPCPTNVSMETAATISDESYTSGYICCPGAEQWFKFVATRTGQYTICTTGNLDTIGTLYDCVGNQPDWKP